MKSGYEMSSKTDEAESGSGVQAHRSKSSGLLAKIVIVLLSVLLIVAVALFVAFVVLYATKSSTSSSSSPPANSSTSPSSANSSDVCQSEACFDLAVQIKGAMDESVDPCEDFYNFTCGHWAAFNHIPEDHDPGTGVLETLQYEVYGNLTKVLHTDFTGGNKVLTELSKFYNSCIAVQLSTILEYVEQLVPRIRAVYEDFGGWSLADIPGDGSEWNINGSQFIRAKMQGSEAFYSIDLGIDHDSGLFVLLFEPGGLSLSPTDYSDTNETEELHSLMRTILSAFVGVDNPDPDKLQDIVDFEIALAGIWEDFSKDDLSSTYTVQELYQLWPNHDWLGVLQGVLSPSGVNLELSSTVQILAPEYFRRLTDLVEATPTETLENYAKWIFTWTALTNILTVFPSTSESVRRFRQHVGGKPTMDQKFECVDVVNEALPLALGRVYVQHAFPAGYKEAGDEMVVEVRAGLRQRIMEVDWLDTETRRLALEKLEAMDSIVAYPDRILDDDFLEMMYGMLNFDSNDYVQNYLQYNNISNKVQFSYLYKPIDKDLAFDSPVEANANYNPLLNQISILAGIMQTPFFNPEFPLSIQYGALGMILGHELTHGFDDCGRQFDKEGRRRMWWSQKAVDAFNDRAQCFVEQYSQYQLFGMQVNGESTLGENLSDNGGIRASYIAYKRVAGKTKKLPGLTKYTDDQLFFIGFGQAWCTYFTASSISNQIRADEHAPEVVRVVGTLSNYETFSEAFNCPSGSSMNPPNKCVVW